MAKVPVEVAMYHAMMNFVYNRLNPLVRPDWLEVIKQAYLLVGINQPGLTKTVKLIACVGLYILAALLF